MKIFVPIDKNTIKLNPYSGQSTFQYALPSSQKLEIIFKKDWKNHDQYTKYIIQDGYLIDEQVILSDKDLRHISFSRDCPYQTIHTLSPEPKYSFQYKQVLITCGCGLSFALGDAYYDNHDEFHCKMCPQCYEILDIKYQDIKEVSFQLTNGEYHI